MNNDLIKFDLSVMYKSYYFFNIKFNGKRNIRFVHYDDNKSKKKNDWEIIDN